MPPDIPMTWLNPSPWLRCRFRCRAISRYCRTERSGALSEAQLETIIYAGEAHARDLVGRFSANLAGDRLIEDGDGQFYRTGFFIADGTGVGKGREAAGIILDQWNRGNRRAIWISMADLIEDARRDWTALGGLAIDIQPIANFPLGKPITMESGIVFLTYAALRSTRHDAASRLQNCWTGPARTLPA
jgi:hypothetical protein